MRERRELIGGSTRESMWLETRHRCNTLGGGGNHTVGKGKQTYEEQTAVMSTWRRVELSASFLNQWPIASLNSLTYPTCAAEAIESDFAFTAKSPAPLLLLYIHCVLVYIRHISYTCSMSYLLVFLYFCGSATASVYTTACSVGFLWVHTFLETIPSLRKTEDLVSSWPDKNELTHKNHRFPPSGHSKTKRWFEQELDHTIPIFPFYKLRLHPALRNMFYSFLLDPHDTGLTSLHGKEGSALQLILCPLQGN